MTKAELLQYINSAQVSPAIRALAGLYVMRATQEQIDALAPTLTKILDAVNARNEQGIYDALAEFGIPAETVQALHSQSGLGHSAI